MSRQYAREKNGKRFAIQGGINFVNPPDTLKPGEYAYLQNVRRLLGGRITGRPTTGDPIYTLSAPPHTILRLNNGASYVRVIGAAGLMYVNEVEVASGFSGKPVSMVPLEPNQSVEPWMYIGDRSKAVTITDTGQLCTAMVKIRSDGLTRKSGIKEPQVAPQVGINTVNVTEWLSLPANTPPWSNIGGLNANYNYSGTDAQPPYPATIQTPVTGATVTLTVTGTATVNGFSHAPGDSAPSSAGYPGNFISSPKVVVFAFTDAGGNIIAQSTAIGAPPVVGNVGASTTLTVPDGAAQLQIGIDSQGTHFASNSGSFLVQVVVSTSSITLVASILGVVQAYIWGDSPHSGPVATYIWKNPNDAGSGIPRTIGTAQSTGANNSLIFDSTPEDGSVPVQWSTLASDGSTVGSTALFAPALESEGYEDFNASVVGQVWIPEGGSYTFQLQYKDQVMFGLGGGATSSKGRVFGFNGQSMTVVKGLPLMFVSPINGSGGQQTSTLTVTFPAAGLYSFELDWDYWYHSGRSLILEMSPTPGDPVATIPPLPQAVRTNVQYWIKYRASETGAQSNPSPASSLELTPVLGNTVTAPYSPDPQVDKYDLYRQDDGLANPTYVATGPNDGLGGTVNGVVYNTSITDTLTDLAAANNQLMQRDDFEPFPSIGSPRAGMVTVVDGVVNWKSGDHFDVRWLPGTKMLIGSPTQQAYVLVSRPLSNSQIVIPGIPDTIGDAAGDGVPYNIAAPVLAQEPIPSMWGPDAYGFVHGCGDANQPGAYVWTKAYNPDSAPDTNRMLLTSPSEPLMGGALINGVSMVFSNLRAWLMYPNFADAQAVTTGIRGNQWNPVLAVVSRGMYIRNCLCSIGGRRIAFRVSDGISITTGAGEQSITGRIYNLFPHENYTPKPIVIGQWVVYPPDDAEPQKLTYQNGYLYYDYGYNYSGLIGFSAPFVPAHVESDGLGIPWNNPAGATGSGVGFDAPVAITGYSITDSIASFTTFEQVPPLVAGQALVISSLSNGTYFNDQTLTVLATGLTTTSFEAHFTHADVAVTQDSGLGSPTVQYAYAYNPGTPAVATPGYYYAFTFPTEFSLFPDSGFCMFFSHAFYSDGNFLIGGGCSGPLNVGENFRSGFSVPNLPDGATITSITAIADGSMAGSCEYNACAVKNDHLVSIWGPDYASFKIIIGGVPWEGIWSWPASAEGLVAWPGYPVLGIEPNDITSASFRLKMESTLNDPERYGDDRVKTYLMIQYSIPSTTAPVPIDQLQVLTATNSGLSIPTTAIITGIEVDFSAGMEMGSPANLTVQLTLGGIPQGSIKTVTPDAWPTPYTLGGISDLWGLARASGSQVNGSNGLGINISGTLPAGSQVDLNSLRGVVYYQAQGTAIGAATLVFDEAGEGWSVDVGEHGFSCHAPDSAEGVAETAVGCSDSTVRILQSDGTEITTSVVATPSDNAGDARSLKRVADVFIRAIVQASDPVTVNLYSEQYRTPLANYSPAVLTGSGSLAPYIVDWGTQQPEDVIDISLAMTWNTGAENAIDLWEPTLLELPVAIRSRATEGLSHGLQTWQHVYMVNLMYVATSPVTITMNTDEGRYSVVWPAAGSLLVPAKISLKPVALKFKTCAYVITSDEPFYLFDCEVWVGAWNRTSAYRVFHPFALPSEPGALL